MGHGVERREKFMFEFEKYWKDNSKLNNHMINEKIYLKNTKQKICQLRTIKEAPEDYADSTHKLPIS